MEIKNMQYWKRKATLPGLNYESENKLPSGLAKSSALQKNEEKEEKKSSAAEDYERASRKAKLKLVKPKERKMTAEEKAKLKLAKFKQRSASLGKKTLSNIHKLF